MAEISNLDEFLATPAEKPAAKRGIFGPATERGFANLVQGVGGLVELAGAEETGKRIQESVAPLARSAGPSKYGIEDLFTSPLGFAGETIAEQIPLMLGVGAGSLVGRGLVAAGTRAAAKEGAKLTAKQLAARQLTGDALSEGVIASSTLGSIYANQDEGEKDRVRAIATGLPSWWLERMGGEQFARQLIGGKIKRPEGMSAMKFAAKQAGRTALVEGPLTEAPQSVLEAIGTQKPLTAKQLLEATVKGSIAGSAFGFGFGMFTPTERSEQQDFMRRQAELLKGEILDLGEPGPTRVDIDVGRTLPPDVQLRFDLNRQLEREGVAPLLPEAPSAGPGLGAVRDAMLEGFEIPGEGPPPPPPGGRRRRAPFPPIGEQITITAPRRPLPGITVEELTPEEAIDLPGVRELPVEDQITLGEASTPEAFAAARRAALDASAGASPNTMELAFTRALAGRMQAQRAAQVEAAHAGRSQQEAAVRAAEEAQLAQAGRRTRLEEAATAIEQGAKPPPRFMREDVDRVVNGITADIAAQGGTTAMPRGLRSKIYGAMKLGAGKGNYGLQIAGLQKLQGTLNETTKGYEIVGKLLDVLRGAQREAQQTTVGDAGGGATTGAAAVSRPSERVPTVPAADKQAGARGAAPAAAASETAKAQIAKGERDGGQRKVAEARGGAARQPAQAGTTAPVAGGRGAEVRPGGAGETGAAQPSAVRRGAVGVGRGEGGADVTAGKPAGRGDGPERADRVVQRGDAGVSKRAADTGPSKGAAGKGATRVGGGAAVAAVAAAPAAKAGNVPAAKPAVPAKESAAERSVKTEEKPRAVPKQSAARADVREAPKDREKVGEEVRGAEKPAAAQARGSEAERKTLPTIKEGMKQIAEEFGVTEADIAKLYGSFKGNLSDEALNSWNNDVRKGFAWTAPRDLESIGLLGPLLERLSEYRVAGRRGSEAGWWYDLNWIKETIRTKGAKSAAMKSGPYRGQRLGEIMVADTTTDSPQPVWKMLANNVRATPSEITKAEEMVAAFERNARDVAAKRRVASERLRKEEADFQKQLDYDNEQARKEAREAATRAAAELESAPNRAARRAIAAKRTGKKQSVLEPKAQELRNKLRSYLLGRTLNARRLEDRAFTMLDRAGAKGVRAGEILRFLRDNTNSPFIRYLTATIMGVPGVSEFKVYNGEFTGDADIPPLAGQEAYGITYPVHKSIHINTSGENKGSLNTLLHELVHAATLYSVYAVRASVMRHVPGTYFHTPQQRKAAFELDKIRQQAVKEVNRRKLNTPGTVYASALEDLEEFVAYAVTNTELQSLLQSITVTLPKNAPQDAGMSAAFNETRGVSLWSWFVNSVRKLLGLDKSLHVLNGLDAVLRLTPSLYTATEAQIQEGIEAEYNTALARPWEVAEEVQQLEKIVSPVGRGDAPTPSALVDNASASVKALYKSFSDKGWVSSLKQSSFRTALGWTTLHQIKDMFVRQFPQLAPYFNAKTKQEQLVTELNNEAGDFTSKMERLIAKHGGWDVTKSANHPISTLYRVMAESTLAEYFPDKTNLYQQPKLAGRNKADADTWMKTAEGQQWLTQVAAVKKDWQALNAKDPALGRLYVDAYNLNKKRYDQSLALFKNALIDNMFDGVFPENLRNADANAKEQWLRQENDRVRPGGFAPDPGRYNVIHSVLKPLNELQKRVAQVRGPYFHLGRFGPYAIRWVDKEGVVNMKRFENRTEFLEAMNALIAEGAHKRSITKDGKEERIWYAELMEDKIKEFDAGSDKFVQSMLQKVDQQYGDEPQRAKVLKQSIRSMYLNMLPDTSFYKVFQKRKGTPGYDPDMLRSFAHRMEVMNRTIGYGMFSREIQQALGDFRAHVDKLSENVGSQESFQKGERGQSILSELRQREVNNVRQMQTPVIDTFTALNYMFYLALSPAYLITNLTQPWMLTMPFLGGRHGWVSSAKGLARSTKTAWAVARHLIDSSLKSTRDTNWMQQVNAAGRPSLSFKDMKFLTDGQKNALESIAKFGQIDLTLAHEIGEVAKFGATSKWGRAKTVGGLASHYSEIINRIAAGLAAYDLEFARTKDQEKAEDYALKIVRRTQFDYSHANLARQMSKQGIFAKYTPLVFAFQRFNAQLLEAYADTTMRAVGKLTEGMPAKEAAEQIAEARKSLAGMFGTAAMFAGLMGLPAANMIFAVMDKLFGDDDEPVDTKALTRQWFADIFGKDLGEALTMGPSRLAGVNLSRTGQQDILPFTRMMSDKRELKDMFEAQAVDQLGPVLGGTFDILKGAQKMAEGNVVEGLKTALPLALRGPTKAFEMGQGYTTDSRGNPIPVNFNSWDVINQAFGFAPPKLAERQAALYTINTRNRLLQVRASKLRSAYYDAAEQKDDSKMQSALADIREWNNKHASDAPILGPELAQGITRRAKQFHTGMTLGPGVGVATAKDLPKLDIAKWANVGR